jgi:hypothetical protein
MRHRQQRVWAVLALVAAGAAACSQADPDPSSNDPVDPVAQEPQAAASGLHDHELDVDWVAFTEADLYRSATAIVRAHVVEQRGGSHRTYPVDAATGRELTPEEAGDEYADLPLTISVVEVDEGIVVSDEARARNGSRVTRGARLEIVQIGGHYEHGCYAVPNDQPLLERGQQAIVYVKPNGMIPHGTADATGMYAIIGGQQGLLPIKDGVVAPIAKTAFERHARRSVAEVTQEIRSLSEQVRSGNVPEFLETRASGCEMNSLDAIDLSTPIEGGE